MLGIDPTEECSHCAQSAPEKEHIIARKKMAHNHASTGTDYAHHKEFCSEGGT